ncbi:hypothetical protein D3C81_441940 [compost metagenome]
MIFVKYYRNDLVTEEPTVEVYFSILTTTANIADLHSQAIEFSKRHPTAVAYQLFEGPHFRSTKPIGLQHYLI